MTRRKHSGRPRPRPVPSPTPEPKPSEERITAAQRDKFALKQEIRRLETLTLVGWRELCREVPALEELREALVEARLRAYPLAGHVATHADDEGKQKPGTLPTTRGGFRDSISKDGLSTTEGRPTLNARKRLQWVDRELHMLALDVLMNSDPDGDPGSTPRCWKRRCRKYAKRQPRGNDYCGACGEPLSTKAAMEAG